MAAFKAPISSSLHARLDWTADRCQGSIIPVWIENFSRTRRSSQIFCVASATAIAQSFSIAYHALSLTLFVRCFESPQRAPSSWRLKANLADTCPRMSPQTYASSAKYAKPFVGSMKMKNRSKQQTDAGSTAVAGANDLDAVMQANVDRVFNERN